MPGPLRQLSSAENPSHLVTAARGRGASADCGPTETGAAHAGCRPRVANLSGLQRDQGPDGIPVPVSRTADTPMDLPLVPAVIHEGLVQEKPQEADRSGLCATRSRSKESRTEIRDYIADHPCVDCGESDADVLDFDHLRNKRANVSRLVHTAVSWDLIVAEISKCEVRCANCHRRRTANLGGYYRAVDARMKAEALTR